MEPRIEAAVYRVRIAIGDNARLMDQETHKTFLIQLHFELDQQIRRMDPSWGRIDLSKPKQVF
jgi:hypothetical protein